MSQVQLEGRHDLGSIRTMPQFRTAVAQGGLSIAEREILVRQAAEMIDGLYVHLLHKRAMYGIEPSQRLRLLRHRLPKLTDAQFHAELLRIFVDLRDLHTNYVLPAPYQGPFAFLGVLLEQYWQGDQPRWLVSKVFDHLTGDPHLVAGAEVSHWNGAPIALAVARTAEREAGSNEAARGARGLENMALRTLALSAPPDEDWVDLRYTVNGVTHETRLPWRIFDSVDEIIEAGGGGGGLAGVVAPASHLIGLDLRTELVRHVKKRLFAPAAMAEQQRVRAAEGDVPPATPSQEAAAVIPTSRPDELGARIVTTPSGTFGHLRVYTFHMQDQNIEAFVNEVIRLLELMPNNGLILDVRGNGGGYLIAAEFLLQLLTPRRVTPEPMQLINSRTTAELCAKVADFAAWSGSVNESIESGAQYSSALPLYPEELLNSVGQRYHGPVVLVTDALCYSATDIFAAGFQDHEIGPVLGVDDNTGAGGANVWTHAMLREVWPDGPFKALPGRAAFRVSLRRSLRVGKRWGQPVEDFGVIPDEVHRLTRADLLDGNVDLQNHAGALLAGRTPRRLDVERGGGNLQLTTAGLDSVDVYVNGRPHDSVAVHDGKNPVTVPAEAGTLRFEGFVGGVLVAARLLPA